MSGEAGVGATAPGDPGPARAPIDPALNAAREGRLREAWRTPKGWRYWSAVNNTEVGLWYAAASFLFFLFGGLLALLMRIQLASPDNDFVSAEMYSQLFTLHGSVMMFLFAIPIFEAISILLLPQILGARDLPFPRLSAYGFWSFALGGAFVCGSIFFGIAPRGGWFMYPPLSTEYQPGLGNDVWLLGLTFIEVASIAAAVELIIGTLKCRPPGMRINLIPLYAWYILVVAVMILFAFPPLIAGDVLLELQRLLDWPFFDPARGGDPLLWQHLFWIFGHPEVYIIFLPSMALVATIVPTFAGRPIVGYGWVVLAAVGTGFLSFGLWVHHMYTTGLPAISLGFFSAASMAVAIPTGVQLFCFIATLMAGRVSRSVPMLFVYGGLASFIVGGFTGVMVALVPFDMQAHDTHFVVSHLHYVLIGGAVFPILAGVHYFFPMIGGKTLSPRLGKLSFWLAFVGFNVTFFPMHFTGLRGMPRRVFTYAPDIGFDTLNLISSVGAFVLGAGILVFVIDVLRPRGRQPYAERNPWGAGTLEWLARMPGEAWGVRTIPAIDSRYPLWQQPRFMRDVDEGRFYLPDAEELKRETMVTSVIDARALQCLRVPGPTWITFWAAMFTGGAFILSTFHLWWLALGSGVLAIGTILVWLWSGTATIPEKAAKDVGLGLTLPLYASGPASVGWWAMFITMVGDVVAFAGLVFGYFFYWTIHEDFPPDPSPGPGWVWPLAGGALLTAAWAASVLARRLNRVGGPGAGGRPTRRRGAGRLGFHLTLLAGAGLALAGAAALLAGPWLSGLDPTAHVYGAIVWVLVLWTAIHAALGCLMQLYCVARSAAGRLTPTHDIDMVNVALYWHFVALTAVVTVAVVAGFPLVA